MIRLEHLETDVIASCQLSCVSCNAFVPLQRAVAASFLVTPEELAEDLQHFGQVAHVDRYALIGGEPTLHPRLLELLMVARDSDVADEVEVWSNGLRVMAMGAAFWAALDRLVVTAYPGKLSDDEIEAIRARCERAGVTFELIDQRQRAKWHQLLEPAPTSDPETQRKFDACRNRRYSHVLDRGHFYRCCTSPFIPRLLQGRPDGSDGLPVAGLTEAALAGFLAAPKAMESCRLCTGFDRRRKGPWRELRTPDAWLQASRGGAA
jgi:hypothetical protein